MNMLFIIKYLRSCSFFFSYGVIQTTTFLSEGLLLLFLFRINAKLAEN